MIGGFGDSRGREARRRNFWVPGFRVRGIEGFEKFGTRWDGRRSEGEARWGEDDDSAARGVRCGAPSSVQLECGGANPKVFARPFSRSRAFVSSARRSGLTLCCNRVLCLRQDGARMGAAHKRLFSCVTEKSLC
jgi:hypothetical protein